MNDEKLTAAELARYAARHPLEAAQVAMAVAKAVRLGRKVMKGQDEFIAAMTAREEAERLSRLREPEKWHGK